MNLKELLGEDYKEGMTPEEMVQALEGRNFVSADALDGKVDKAVLDKALSKIGELNRQLKERLTKEEQEAAVRKERDEAFNSMKRELTAIRMQSEFLSAGYDKETAEKLVNAALDGNYEDFSSCTSAFLEGQRESLYAQAKEELLKGTSGSGTGGTDEHVDTQFETLAKNLGKTRAEANKAAQSVVARYIGGKA